GDRMTVRWNAQPSLRRPTLVAAFSGWNDAADAASARARWLAPTPRAPAARGPPLVAALSGWTDAAAAASDGVRWLARTVGARVFATLDTEEYLDFQAARPTVELVDGVIREIQWPSLAFSGGALPGGGRGLVLVLGV